MTREEIEERKKALDNIMAEYHQELAALEKELGQTIREYTEALTEEKLRELRSTLNEAAPGSSE